jgi:hypothetical protein
MYGTNLRKTRSLQICEQKEQRATMIYNAVRGMDMVCDSLSYDLQRKGSRKRLLGAFKLNFNAKFSSTF